MITKQTIFNEAKAAGFEAWIILWLGTDEWELFYGTLDKARERVMGDRAYSNYGHKGAVILPLSLSLPARFSPTVKHLLKKLHLCAKLCVLGKVCRALHRRRKRGAWQH